MTEALAERDRVPDGWQPDVVLQLSPALLDEVLSELLSRPLQTDLAKGALHVTQRVKSVEVRAADGCADCIGLDLALRGKLTWLPGTPALSGSTQIETSLSLDGELEAVRSGKTWTASLRLVRVHGLDLVVEGRRAIPDLGADLDRSVTRWLEEALPAMVPPIPLSTFDDDTMPLLALRVLPDSGGVRIDARSTAVSGGRAKLSGGAPAEGFRVAVSADTALALARAAAFRNGEVGYGVVPEPTALEVGDGFSLGLRLWRPVGRGWWRDYTITGTMAVKGGKLKLEPEGVSEGDKSPGATAADPLAALFEGKILSIIESAVQTPVPTEMGGALGKAKLSAVLESISGADGTLVAEGKASIGR